MPGHRYVEENGSAAMLAIKRSAGVTPEVNLQECVTHTPPPSANKAAHSGFETQRRHHEKFKTGVSVAPPMLVQMWTSMWIKMAKLPCWLARVEQVSHQRWTWGITGSPKQGYQWPHKKDLSFNSVVPEVNLRNPLHAGNKVYKQEDPPWVWNPEETSPEAVKRFRVCPVCFTYHLISYRTCLCLFS